MTEKLPAIQLDAIFSTAVREGASDIHFKGGSKPFLRVNGELRSVETRVLSGEDVAGITRQILSENRLVDLNENRNVDASYEQKVNESNQRFRVNAAYDQEGPYVTMRLIPSTIISVSDIGFPSDVWRDIIALQRGLVLVTGITGSGKTTTLASLVQEINRTRADRIILLEDPVEYRHIDDKSFISQRELGGDLRTFSDGVKYALRQDPDVLLVGEIRDAETARGALEAAETGHLVLSTLHTKSAAETVRRYVNIFVAEDQAAARDSLASNLAYVLSQQLVPYRKGVGRKLAMEVMNVGASAAIRKHIREGEYHQIINQIQMGAREKMLTMDDCLRRMCRNGILSTEEAALYAHDTAQFAR